MGLAKLREPVLSEQTQSDNKLQDLLLVMLYASAASQFNTKDDRPRLYGCPGASPAMFVFVGSCSAVNSILCSAPLTVVVYLPNLIRGQLF